jgi:hypothetical protein
MQLQMVLCYTYDMIFIIFKIKYKFYTYIYFMFKGGYLHVLSNDVQR